MSSIEVWYEHNYPSFVLLGQNGVTYDPEDKRTAVIKLEEKCAQAKHYPNGSSSESFPWELMAFVGGAIAFVILLSAGVIFTVAQAYASA
jgi:farnesyl-diphosphate farnesyltransferase